jgi:hypothetical protein
MNGPNSILLKSMSLPPANTPAAATVFLHVLHQRRDFTQVKHRGEPARRSVRIGAADPREDLIVDVLWILAGKHLGHDATDRRGGGHVNTGKRNLVGGVTNDLPGSPASRRPL